MLFTRKRKFTVPILKLDDHRISFVESFKYLGIIFDSKLSYKAHVDHVAIKCLKRINLLRMLSGTSWGASQKPLLTIYRATIRPILEYGLGVYLFATKTVLKKLNSIRNSALRICCGAMKSTPIDVIEAANNEMPLHIRHKLLCCKYRCWLSCNPNHPTSTLLEDSWEEIYAALNPKFSTFNTLTKVSTLQDINIKSRTSLPTPPWLIPSIKIDLSLTTTICKNSPPEIVNSVFSEFIHTLYQDYVAIFTDGSKTSNSTGFAIYVPGYDVSISKTCSQFHSVFSMELHAINTAVSWITESGLKKAIILSDCQSALASISNPHRSRHFIVNEIISNINRLKTNKISVSLAWIPGHAGIKGNEKADSLAKKAAQRRPEQNTVALSTDEVKNYLYNVCKCKWNEVYQECEKGWQYKTLRPTIHTKLSELPSRRYNTVIFRMRSVHCRLNQHLKRIGCAPSPLCHR